MFPASTKGGGYSIGWPDVCKTPTVSGGVSPIPYPSIGTTTSTKGTKPLAGTTKPVAAKGTTAAQLRGHLDGLHKDLMTMSRYESKRWHTVLDEYVVTAAEVYRLLGGR